MSPLKTPLASELTDEQIQQCLAAVADIRECYRLLEKGGLNVVGEILKAQGPFYEMDHYPKDDVFDRDTGAQYYYHAHREDHDEHGHFHLFMRDAGLAPSFTPAFGPSDEDWVAHLVAISMDAWGYPTELFAVNRWVTDDSWLPAEALIAALDRFEVDHAYPSLPVNRWLSAMVRCFRPQIESLIRHREQQLSRTDSKALADALEDRSLEITGGLKADVDAWADQLLAEQQSRQIQVAAG